MNISSLYLFKKKSKEKTRTEIYALGQNLEVKSFKVEITGDVYSDI